jgi:tRNA G18 (ribose-2'-O)-methylase SpoU
MPRIAVESPDDPRLSDYRCLNERNLTRQSGKFIAEGDKVVERLIASPFPVASLLAEADWADRLEPLVPPETPMYVADHRLLEQTIGYNFHRGVLATGLRGGQPVLEDVLAKLREDATIVVCPEIYDPTNLGVLIRTAAAFGTAAVLLGSQSAFAFSRRVLRVSMGAVLQIPIIETDDFFRTVQILRAHRFDIAATVLSPTAIPLAQTRRSSRQAIVLGSEGHGLGPEWTELADRLVTLPMQLGIDSLNVAVASAVFLYHFSYASGSGY